MQKAIDRMVSVLLLIGGVAFIVWPAGYVIDHARIASWEEKECLIDSFWFEQPENSGYHQLHVRFYYRHDDVGYTSENLSLDVMDYMHTADAGPLVSELTPGSEHTCYVNPEKPHQAILFKPMGLQVFIWWFGLLMGIGFFAIGMIIFKNSFRSNSQLSQ